jgi:ADP-ribosylglycohydrolase
MTIDRISRYRGALAGLASGDAVGTAVEFQEPGTFKPVKDMTGGGPFDLDAGEWTDDTSMALCLAESLVKREKFDPMDQMERYLKWYREGYLSSTGNCFDVGGTISSALEAFEQSNNPFSGSSNPFTAGNGSLMRLAPVPMFFATNPEEAVLMSAESSLTTHGAVEAVDACKYFGGLIVGALNGVDKETLLSPRWCPVEGLWNRELLAPKIDEVARGSFKEKHPPEIEAKGYVVKTLEAALWAFHTTHDFRSGCLKAVNLGWDTDTVAAVYGQLAGAYYGFEAIPEAWRGKLAMGGYILQLADELCQMAWEE